ncbi:uncharacterized protein [Primulina eburnea]|uniref:uncharacterized protein n=1 Tax=Primulina eburnea TaxID=1245227 RepID=UPI003C6BE500
MWWRKLWPEETLLIMLHSREERRRESRRSSRRKQGWKRGNLVPAPSPRQIEGRSHSRVIVKRCPFAEVVIREPLPGNFKFAKVKDYDGHADPEEHLARFEKMAMLHCYSDRIKCKVFLTTLVDSTQRWFEGLAPQSIYSFEDFEKVFLHHFSSSKKYKKTVVSLFEVKQSLEESLRAYIRKFNRVALDVHSCAPETKITAFTQGMREKDCKTLKREYVPPAVRDIINQARSRDCHLGQLGSLVPVPGNIREVPRGGKRNPKPKRKKSPPLVLGVLKMISGGSTDGDSNRAQKSRSRRDCMEVEGMRKNEAVISFGREDIKGVNLPHNDALVIQATVANYDIMRVFVESGSFVNLILKDSHVQINLQGYQLETVETSLYGFAGHGVYPEGENVMPLTLGIRELKKTVMTTFTILDAPLPYNIILVRLAMNELRAVASTYDQKIKFVVGGQVGEVRGDQPSS